MVALVEKVIQRYGAAVALDSVTIEIPAGRIVGFIGPDGVGKSSLLSVVAGARQLQSGHVVVLDGDMRDRLIGPRSALASPICRKD